jgi:hypothetical protein
MMAGTSSKTKVVTVRVPNDLLAQIDAKGGRSGVILAALDQYLGPVGPVTCRARCLSKAPETEFVKAQTAVSAEREMTLEEAFALLAAEHGE